MKKNADFFIRLFLLAFVIPLIMSIMAYAGFFTNYTAEVFSQEGFEHYYRSGIYKYRLISPDLLIHTYQLIKAYDLPTIFPHSLTVMDSDGDPQFYSAYFYVNTFFLCLTCLIVIMILSAGRRSPDFLVLDLPIIFLCALIALTQYVIVPYDTISYFLLSLAVALILSRRRSWWRLLSLSAILVIATLIRETSAFILALYFAVDYREILPKPGNRELNSTQAAFLVLIFCFLCTYIGLRIALGSEQSIFQAFLLARNMNLSYSILGLLFFASVSLLFLTTPPITKEMTIFSVVTFPYVIFVFLFADPWEIRLWVPMILPLLILKVRAVVSVADHGPPTNDPGSKK